MVDEHDPWATWLERHAASLILLARQYVTDRSRFPWGRNSSANLPKADAPNKKGRSRGGAIGGDECRLSRISHALAA